MVPTPLLLFVSFDHRISLSSHRRRRSCYGKRHEFPTDALRPVSFSSARSPAPDFRIRRCDRENGAWENAALVRPSALSVRQSASVRGDGEYLARANGRAERRTPERRHLGQAISILGLADRPSGETEGGALSRDESGERLRPMNRDQTDKHVRLRNTKVRVLRKHLD